MLWSAWSRAEADHARIRYANHSNRLSQDERQSTENHEEKVFTEPAADAQVSVPIDPKKATIAAALARARAQRATPPG